MAKDTGPSHAPEIVFCERDWIDSLTQKVDELDRSNSALRTELDAVWKFLHQVFDGRFDPSAN